MPYTPRRFSTPILGGILLLAALVLSREPVQAQQEKKLLTDNVQMRRYLQQTRFDIDTAAQAVILYEKGNAMMTAGRVTLKIERIVKILSQEAADDFGDISLTKSRDVTITDIEAETYNLNGVEIVSQAVTRADILKDKVAKGITVSKFSLPSLKAGSVIHYSYTTITDGYLIPDWVFQNNYPTLYSEYEVSIPDYILYSAMLRVTETCITARKRKELESCASCTFSESFGKGEPVYTTWVRRNIPAFREEPFMSSGDNYIERVKIKVNAVMDDGIKRSIYKDWDEYCTKFYYKNDALCGQVYNNNNFLAEPVSKLAADKKTELDKAKAIFDYVRSNFKRKEKEESGVDIKEVFGNKSGSVADINLLLTAMLRKAGLNSAPVLLATKENEQLSPYYPDPQNINYIVSKVEADQKVYFLDASGKYMPFGTLLPVCYNGYCRVITEKGDYAMLSSDSLKNKITVIATLAPAADKDKLQLQANYQFGTISSLRYRKSWMEDSSKVKEHLVKQLKATNSALTTGNYYFANIDRPDEPLKLHYEATIDMSGAQEVVYFNPYFDKFFEKNPFTAAKRTYPVEMDYQSDMCYILNFTLPENYTLDDYPKSALIKLGNDEVMSMKNLMQYDEAAKQFNINSRLITRATSFSPGAYEELRSFFDHVIQEQQKKIVLKKIH